MHVNTAMYNDREQCTGVGLNQIYVCKDRGVTCECGVDQTEAAMYVNTALCNDRGGGQLVRVGLIQKQVPLKI